MIKIFLLFFIILLNNCKSVTNQQESLQKHPFNTEIFCPNSYYRFLILQSTKAEVEMALDKAIIDNEASNKRTKYTVLYLPDKRNTSIYNITPQEIRRDCVLFEKLRY